MDQQFETREPALYPSLTDRPVLISGGASGIGAAMVAAFAGQGARIGFVDIDGDRGAQLARDIAGEGARHAPVFRRLDLCDLAAIEAEVPVLIEAIGGCGVLVNNAAHDERHPLEAITPEYWRDRLAVNLDHQVFMAKAVLPAMERGGGGAIVNMGSLSWRVGLENLTAYVTAKAAVEGLTNGLARELGQRNIRVNCIIPGFIRTERQVEKWLTPELERRVIESQCLKELIEPEYVARMAVFLASDDGRMCSSSCYCVDGGWR